MIGRTKEQAQLLRAYESDESEFVTIYGRRRIGKTYLVNETFQNRLAFHHAGLKLDSVKAQLEHFRLSLLRHGYFNCPKLKTWLEAFYHLEIFLASGSEGKKVVFFDEMPWMDTFKSGFLTALEAFWNGWASARKDILLIACGSATTWIVNKLHRNLGGLHNRVTKRIKLYPFTLRECELYARERKLGYERPQILECYMVFGGVAYYWSLLEKGLSVSQNINELFFNQQDGLKDEFRELYDSLFKNSEPYIAIVKELGKRKVGLTRNELLASLGKTSNGNISTCLTNLEECGFIRKYNNALAGIREAIYQLIDNYTIFYFQFVKGKTKYSGDFWTDGVSDSVKNTWRGLAFERVCLEHIPQIKKALGISAVVAEAFSWRNSPSEANAQGTQIDLVIDRKDDVINLCEIKFSTGVYTIDKTEHLKLLTRLEQLRAKVNHRKSLHLTMITAAGLAHNAYWNDVQAEVTANDLFED